MRRIMMEVDDPLNILEQQLQEHLKQKDDWSLLVLLHDIALRFENDRRYWNDTRYVRIWLQYATFFIDPTCIYQHMFQHHIGEYVGAFYLHAAEYYAIYKNSWQEAEELIHWGIQCKAEPLSQLHETLHDIRQRQMEPKLLTSLKDRLIPSLQTQKQAYAIAKNNQQKVIDAHQSLKRQRMRMATIQRCYQGPEMVSFEELRAQLVKHSKATHFIQDQRQTTFVIGSRSEAKSTPTATTAKRVFNRTDQLQQQSNNIPHVVSLPHNTNFIRHTLNQCPSWKTLRGLHDCSSKRSKRIHIGQLLLLDGTSFHITQKVGQGGMARVYHALRDKQSIAIKVEKPANPWEFYILHQLDTKLVDKRFVASAYDFYLYKDASYLTMAYEHQGTLLDCFNQYRDHRRQSTMPEPLSMFLMMRLLEAVQAIHQVGIVHGDLKMDNVMINIDEEQDKQQADYLSPWPRSNVYLVLIDFGRGVDLAVLSKDVLLKADWSPQVTDPIIIHLGHAFPPRFIDYYGVASIAHWLLFGKPMQVVKGKDGEKHYTQERWKRYWHVDLWERLFNFLLDPTCSLDQVATVIRMGYQILQHESQLATHLSQFITALRS